MKQNEKHKFRKGALQDVVIIGDGIAGLSAAHLLTKKGLNVLCFDSGKNHGGHSFFLEVVSVQAQGWLEEIFGKSILFGLEGTKLERVVTKWNSPKISVLYCLPPYKPLAINRAVLLSQLREIAVRAGVRIRPNTAVIGILDKEDFAVLRTKTDCFEEEIHANMVIIATGRKSRRVVDEGLSYKPKAISCGFKTQAVNGLDFYIEGTGPSDEWWYALPFDEKSSFLCTSIPLEVFKRHKYKKKLVQELYQQTELIRSVFSDITVDGNMVYRWGGAHQWDSVVGKSWLCIGDAGYVHHPLSGRGLDFALFSAQLSVDMILNTNGCLTCKRYESVLKEYIKTQTEYEHHWLHNWITLKRMQI